MNDVLSLFAFWSIGTPMVLALGALGWYAARVARPRLALLAPVVSLIAMTIVDLIAGGSLVAPTARLVGLNVLVGVLTVIPTAMPAALMVWYGARRPMRPWIAGALTGLLALVCTPLSVFVMLFASCVLLRECI